MFFGKHQAPKFARTSELFLLISNIDGARGRGVLGLVEKVVTFTFQVRREGEESFAATDVLLSLNAQAKVSEPGQRFGMGASEGKPVGGQHSIRTSPHVIPLVTPEKLESVSVDPESLESFDLRCD